MEQGAQREAAVPTEMDATESLGEEMELNPDFDHRIIES